MDEGLLLELLYEIIADTKWCEDSLDNLHYDIHRNNVQVDYAKRTIEIQDYDGEKTLFRITVEEVK
jgi:hypothetical protein